MERCHCQTPPFNYRHYDRSVLGVDATNGRYGEVAIEICKACGTQWLCYHVENEAFSRSGRWYRGLVPPEVLPTITPERAAAVIAALPWYFYGGSFFESTGRRGSGPLQVDG